METKHTNLKLIYEKGKLKTNNLNINNGIFQRDSLSPFLFFFFFFFFCIAPIPLTIELKNTYYGLKTSTKNKLLILCELFKVICKNNDDLEGLLSTVKIFNDNLAMQFGLEKRAKVTFKKGSPVNSENITLDINRKLLS